MICIERGQFGFGTRSVSASSSCTAALAQGNPCWLLRVSVGAHADSHTPRGGRGGRVLVGFDRRGLQRKGARRYDDATGRRRCRAAGAEELSDRANLVARAEAAVWLALQDIGVNDRIIVLNEILRETLAKAREKEAAERL
jgi:hypothetical protein